ncbi:MAG: hypothetical protein COV99_07415 [Bacteroidetes bacterium CG12_big_fil_rev_8_21_14_0_65_60_17]|nr:MAG: hypothetical protein COV99_07415 [Bacteroidetes bacterium CG12_big_fil_rev_8_21_14_0_65_60_17]
MIGTTLSHYSIVAELGRGGMGIVYKALDTKLDRSVALKVLPSSALASEDDRARFYREAKAAAALNHAHIAQIYQIDEAVPLQADGAPLHGHDDVRPFIAMEFIDGETLEARIKQGPLKLSEVVILAQQAASALGAAHEKGIVHRDIKSANVMLTAKGDVKVLDFGLAQTAASTKLTRMGSTLGTVAYMSPEQARGEEVDSRTDLWALGVTLYEMIAGRNPFGGDYEQAVVYSILNTEPEPLTAVRTGVPMELERITNKLLAKEAARRYQSAADLTVDLGNLDIQSISGLSRSTLSVSGGAPAAAGAPPKGTPGNARSILRTAGLIAAALLVATSAYVLGRAQAGSPELPGAPKRITQTLYDIGDPASVDISPQGDKVAFAASGIHVLELASGDVQVFDVPGAYVHLAFSPDGSELLVTTAEGLVRLSIATGAVIDLGNTIEGGPRGEWVSSSYIIYEEEATVYGRSLNESAGRRLVELDTLAGQYDLDYPSILPDGKTIMATAEYGGNQPDRIGFWDLETGRTLKLLDVPGTRAHYISSGHLIVNVDGRVMAVPFDMESLAQTGPIVQIDAPVKVEGMAVSGEGTLVHAGMRAGVVTASGPSTPLFGAFNRTTILLQDRASFPPGRYNNAAIHPSGDFAAVALEGEVRAGGGLRPSDIWILDFETGSRRALTSGGRSMAPAWSPSGDSLYFVEFGGNSRLKIMAASGRGGARVVVDPAIPALYDLDVSPNKKWAVMAAGIPPTMDAATDMLIVDLETEEVYSRGLVADRLTAPGGNPRHLAFSPDSKYLAYEDQGAIRVQSMEDLDSVPITVWENGMTLPKWSPDGSVLHGIRLGQNRAEMDVQTDPVFRVLGERFVDSPGGVYSTSLFDLFPDNSGFMMGYPTALSTDTSGATATDATTIRREGLDVHFIINVSGLVGQ